MKTLSPPVGRRFQKQQGFSFFTLLLFIALAGLLFSFLASTAPKLYECFLLRELADRVVKEFAPLPLEEVQRRVKIELGRSRVILTQESFRMLPTTQGYRVAVRYEVPLELRIGEHTFTVEGYEKWVFLYEVES
ncbi:hypothetical protein [Candidatus Magnetaquicoccus inordinatus]|uniref:hypothetical protein n=1 Tax=Candidatus Magnetaquicoccus inordinatus TaxID=2496818 RepID=UPI00102B3AE8|nr:hypothetical protein [Candidatus Magnetaquicoccus inordinatus]